MDIGQNKKGKKASLPPAKKKVTKPVRGKVKKTRVAQASDDEEIRAKKGTPVSGAEEQVESDTIITRVVLVPAFTGGIVSPVLDGAINAHWRKSPEMILLVDAMDSILKVDGAFFGDVVVKTSFITRVGGNVLL